VALTTAPALDVARDAAVEVGAHLCRTAVWHEDRCTWTGDDTDGAGEACHRSMGPDLYGGTTGIAWFLAHLWATTGGDDVLAAAKGATRHALRRSSQVEKTGLLPGCLGVAVGTLAAARVMGDDELQAEALACCRSAVTAPPSSSFDLIDGLAGEVLALLALARVLDSDACLTAATSRATALVRSGVPATRGRAWENRDQPPQVPLRAPLCGLAHGASGVVLALTELAATTGERSFDEAIAGALAYERAWFDRRHGGWPDLRQPDGDGADQDQGPAAGGSPAYPWYWCHGSSGIGLARLRAVERTGDTTVTGEAGAALDHATSACLRSFPVGGGASYATNVSLCHGIGSVVELHLEAARVAGNDEHIVHARRLALAGRAQGVNDDPRGSVDVDQLPCGVYGGGENPSLMLGLAGFGAALLRAADPGACPSPLMVQDWLGPHVGR
jgi:lantibiotic modifying enzyme